jgi:hypothetical protein
MEIIRHKMLTEMQLISLTNNYSKQDIMKDNTGVVLGGAVDPNLWEKTASSNVFRFWFL